MLQSPSHLSPTLSLFSLTKKNIPFSPMPSTQPKSWGKVDKAALYKLIVDGEVDIEDLTYENMDAVHKR
jgi:hypothetical protein